MGPLGGPAPIMSAIRAITATLGPAGLRRRCLPSITHLIMPRRCSATQTPSPVVETRMQGALPPDAYSTSRCFNAPSNIRSSASVLFRTRSWRLPWKMGQTITRHHGAILSTITPRYGQGTLTPRDASGASRCIDLYPTVLMLPDRSRGLLSALFFVTGRRSCHNLMKSIPAHATIERRIGNVSDVCSGPDSPLELHYPA